MKNGLAWRIKNLSLAVYQKNSVLLFKLLWNCEWSSLHLKNVFFPSVYRWKRAHLVCRKRNSNVIPSTIVTSLCLEISPVRWHNGVKSFQKHHSDFTIFFSLTHPLLIYVEKLRRYIFWIFRNKINPLWFFSMLNDSRNHRRRKLQPRPRTSRATVVSGWFTVKR